MNAYGYIKISRKLFDTDPFWQEDRVFSRVEAWLDLIQRAAYRSHELCINGEVVTICRGQLVASERFLEKRWGWSRTKVRRFLKELQRMGRVIVEKSDVGAHLGTVVSLCNYDRYQAPTNGDETRHIPAEDQRRAVDVPRGHQREENKIKERKEKQNTGSGSIDSDPDFERAWEAFPKRAGGNPKALAYRAWKARRGEGATSRELIAAIDAYASYIRVSGKEHTEYVKQCATFLGPDGHWKEKYGVSGAPNTYTISPLVTAPKRTKKYDDLTIGNDPKIPPA